MPRKTNESKTLNNEQMALLGIEYVELKKKVKVLNEQISKNRVPLKEYVSRVGTELPNGSKLARITHADVDVNIKQTARNGRAILPGALDVLKELGLYDDLVTMMPVIDEAKLEALYKSGAISPENLLRICEPTVTMAFSVALTKHVEDE
jgi:hypothetical protein